MNFALGNSKYKLYHAIDYTGTVVASHNTGTEKMYWIRPRRQNSVIVSDFTNRQNYCTNFGNFSDGLENQWYESFYSLPKEDRSYK